MLSFYKGQIKSAETLNPPARQVHTYQTKCYFEGMLLIHQIQEIIKLLAKLKKLQLAKNVSINAQS
jgi:hypothetical protein